jgi:hypothetical protein
MINLSAIDKKKRKRHKNHSCIRLKNVKYNIYIFFFDLLIVNKYEMFGS